jgi:hypothetical protein
MTWLEAVNLLAITLSPVIAVQASTWLERRRQRRDRQVEIFRALMATRIQNLSARHVDALNIIDVEFAGGGAKEQKVRDAWNVYLDHLGSAQDPSWGARRQERFIDLIYAMNVCLGYGMDRTHIKNVVYHPQAFDVAARNEDLARNALIALANGKVSVPVHMAQQPENSQLSAIEAQTSSQDRALEQLRERVIENK